MKKLFTCLFFLMIQISFIFSKEQIKLEGSWSYSFSSDFRSCTLKGDKIVNKSDETESFKLILVLTRTKFEPPVDRILGCKVGSKFYSSLEPGYQYQNISLTFGDFEKKQPSTGFYYVGIVLLSMSNKIIDYLSFDKPVYFINTILDETNLLLKKLHTAESELNGYDFEMDKARIKMATAQYGSYSYNYASETFDQAVKNSRLKITEIGEIKKKLTNIGYGMNQMASTEFIP